MRSSVLPLRGCLLPAFFSCKRAQVDHALIVAIKYIVGGGRSADVRLSEGVGRWVFWGHKMSLVVSNEAFC